MSIDCNFTSPAIVGYCRVPPLWICLCVISFTVTTRNPRKKHKACWSHVSGGLRCTLQIWMHLQCFHFALTAVPSVLFHSAKRLMCFPRASVCWDVFQTFYIELNCLTANQRLISSVDHMLQHMFHRIPDNANTLCFVLLLPSYRLRLFFSTWESVKWQVTSVLHNLAQNHSCDWIGYIKKPWGFFLGEHGVAFRKHLWYKHFVKTMGTEIKNMNQKRQSVLWNIETHINCCLCTR